MFADAFRIFAELSWADIYNSEGLDYKEYTNKQKDSFAIFRSKKIFKFRITQKYRCSGEVVNGVFHVLMFDLTHKLSDWSSDKAGIWWALMTRTTNSVHFFKIFTLPPSIFILFCIYYRIKKPFRKSFCQSILACMGWFINIDYWNLKKHEFKIPVFDQNKKVHPKEISTVQRDKKSEATNNLFRLLRYSGLL